MSAPAVIVGIGGPSSGDDAAGLLVARALSARGVPAVEATDATVLLPYLEEGRRVIVVDAIEGGGRPGDVVRLRPDALAEGATPVSSHGLGVLETIRLAGALHHVDAASHVEIVGIVMGGAPSAGSEPSPVVAQAIDRAAALAERLARGPRRRSRGAANDGAGALVVAGTAHVALAQAVVGALGQALGRCAVEPFPDGELRVVVGEEVCGRDVYVVQPTIPPVGEHILELVLVADALRRASAARITAVVPYFGFARQERRVHPGEPLGARVAADLVACGGFARLVAVDLHAASVEGFFPFPVEQISAVPILAPALERYVKPESVIVSPDLGGAKLAREYARRLGLPVAVVHKTRISGREVEVEDVVGDVVGRSCIIVDDLISTGGTIAAACKALRARGAHPEVTVAASHALLAGDAGDVLVRAGVARLVATDTVPERPSPGLVRETVSVAPLLADVIRRLSRCRASG